MRRIAQDSHAKGARARVHWPSNRRTALAVIVVFVSACFDHSLDAAYLSGAKTRRNHRDERMPVHLIARQFITDIL